MKTSFREDIELEDHEHYFELANISIKFKYYQENDFFVWAVCTNCHEFKQNVSSEEVESWYTEN
jgi:hypothetical protein